MSKMLGIILAGMMALSLTTTACQCERGPTQIPRVGEPAPEFELPTLDGQTVSLSDLQDRPVMVNFWATWCRPCVYEMPYIQEVYNHWKAYGLVVLAINSGDSPSQIQQFMEANKLTFPVLLDEDGEITTRYNIRGWPTTIFIDKEGVIRLMRVGAFLSRSMIEENLQVIIP